ncbi:MAG: hypothetical protein D6782_07060 [Alphaproteobacteria bacterium]|nr:MAG: hypothetical protein D6782_07060 [Alphaproteobacteria bacterium]
MGGAIYRLVFASAATRPFDDGSLSHMVRAADARAVADNLTGMMLFLDGNFLFIVEGASAAVEAAFAETRGDPRHSATMVLLREEGDKRLFADWSMGYRRMLASDPARPAGAFELNRAALRARFAGGAAMRLLPLVARFYQTNTREPL